MLKIASIKRIVLVLLMIAGVVLSYGFVPANWMDKDIGNTASESIVTGAGAFYGWTVTTDGTNDVTFTFYDSTAASGTKVIKDTTIKASTADPEKWQGFDPPVRFNRGLYCVITTAGTCTYDVFYREQ